MINYKTEKEIQIMREGGRILAEVLWEVLQNLTPGVSEIELDQLAEKLILKKGGKPGFKMVPGYNHTLCISTNETIVHGIPGKYKFKKGDVVGIDCGVFYKGFHTDMSETISVGSLKNSEADLFLKTGKKALKRGIEKATLGNRIGDISKAIQEIVENSGYSVVRSLVGHGVGRELHEDPEVPGFLDKVISETPALKPGMTIAIEVIYNMETPDVVYSQDGWTIKTADGGISGLFERTIAITDKGTEILTKTKLI